MYTHDAAPSEEQYDLYHLCEALATHDTGHWEWDRIHCCLTGKNADLESWGQQGIELLSTDNTHVVAQVHLYTNIPGEEVCLNLPVEVEENDDAYLAAVAAYMGQAELIVHGAYPILRGEWDGSDWDLFNAVEFVVPWIRDGDGIDYATTAQKVVDAANEAVKPLEEESILAHELIDFLAGWRTRLPGGKVVDCLSGQPGPEAAWNFTLQGDAL